MGVESVCFRIHQQEVLHSRTTTVTWKEIGRNYATDKGGSKHAERVAWASVTDQSAARMLLFAQTAFPCSECHEWFQQLSNSRTFVLVWVAIDNPDSCPYKSDHKNSRIGTNMILYDHSKYNYKKSMNFSMFPAPAAGLPALPTVRWEHYNG